MSQSEFIAKVEPLNQSEALIKIECFVNALRRGGETSVEDRVEAWSFILDALPQIVALYDNNHDYSEHLEAFWFACEKVKLLGWDGVPTEKCRTFLSLGDKRMAVMQDLMDAITGYTRTKQFHRRASDRRYEAKKKSEQLTLQAKSLLFSYEKVLTLRVSLGYKKEAGIRIDEVYTHIDRLMERVRDRKGMFNGLAGYAWCIEQSISRGYHMHSVLVFSGHVHQRDGNMAREFGRVWEEITAWRGTYHSCNTEKNECERLGRRGVGMIHREDDKAVENALNAIEYLAKPGKDDQYLRMRPKGRRTYASAIFDRVSPLDILRDDPPSNESEVSGGGVGTPIHGGVEDEVKEVVGEEAVVPEIDSGS